MVIVWSIFSSMDDIDGDPTAYCRCKSTITMTASNDQSRYVSRRLWPETQMMFHFKALRELYHKNNLQKPKCVAKTREIRVNRLHSKLFLVNAYLRHNSSMTFNRVAFLFYRLLPPTPHQTRESSCQCYLQYALHIRHYIGLKQILKLCQHFQQISNKCVLFLVCNVCAFRQLHAQERLIGTLTAISKPRADLSADFSNFKFSQIWFRANSEWTDVLTSVTAIFVANIEIIIRHSYGPQ